MHKGEVIRLTTKNAAGIADQLFSIGQQTIAQAAQKVRDSASSHRESLAPAEAVEEEENGLGALGFACHFGLGLFRELPPDGSAV